MKIKKSTNSLSIEISKAKAVLPLNILKYKHDKETDIVLLNRPVDDDFGASLVISSPGEYEKNDIFVFAFSLGGIDNDAFSIDADGMNVLIFNSSADVTNLLDNDDISENNILICNYDGTLGRINDVIDELEPNIFILTGHDGAALEEVVKKLSLSTGETQNSVSYGEDDFSEENERPMQIVLLK